jgi:hypothetical protein
LVFKTQPLGFLATTGKGVLYTFPAQIGVNLPQNLAKRPPRTPTLRRNFLEAQAFKTSTYDGFFMDVTWPFFDMRDAKIGTHLWRTRHTEILVIARNILERCLLNPSKINCIVLSV